MKAILRRSFLTAIANGITIMQAKSPAAAPSAYTVNLGVIGCGRRGIYIGTSFMENTGTRVVTIADLFEDRLTDGKKQFDEACKKTRASEIKK